MLIISIYAVLILGSIIECYIANEKDKYLNPQGFGRDKPLYIFAWTLDEYDNRYTIKHPKEISDSTFALVNGKLNIKFNHNKCVTDQSSQKKYITNNWNLIARDEVENVGGFWDLTITWDKQLSQLQTKGNSTGLFLDPSLMTFTQKERTTTRYKLFCEITEKTIIPPKPEEKKVATNCIGQDGFDWGALLEEDSSK
jgi:hypothetical protein